MITHINPPSQWTSSIGHPMDQRPGRSQLAGTLRAARHSNKMAEIYGSIFEIMGFSQIFHGLIGHHTSKKSSIFHMGVWLVYYISYIMVYYIYGKLYVSPIINYTDYTFGGFLRHGGIPSSHPFIDGIFQYHPAIGVPHLRKPPYGNIPILNGI